MNRVLVRIIAAALLLFAINTVVLAVVVLIPRQQDYAFLERSLNGNVSLAVRAVESAGDPEAELARLNAVHDWPLVVVDRATVPEPALRRMESGGLQAVIFSVDGIDYVGAVLADGRVLRMGPFAEWPLPPASELLVALLVTILLWVLALAAVLRPTARALRRLEQTAGRIETGDWSARAEVHRDVAPLARAFNRMAAQTERVVGQQRELLHAVSHELRTPLARLEYAVRDLRRARGEAAHAAAEEEVREEFDRLDALIGELLEWSRIGASEPEREHFDARELVEERALGLGLSVRIEGQGKAFVSRADMARALDNLLRNAMIHGSAPIVAQIDADARGLIVTVHDGGRGLPGDQHRSALEPFVQLDGGPGHGLGLALVARIVESHGGSVELGRGPNGGLLVRTLWPE